MNSLWSLTQFSVKRFAISLDIKEHVRVWVIDWCILGIVSWAGNGDLYILQIIINRDYYPLFLRDYLILSCEDPQIIIKKVVNLLNFSFTEQTTYFWVAQYNQQKSIFDFAWILNFLPLCWSNLQSKISNDACIHINEINPEGPVRNNNSSSKNYNCKQFLAAKGLKSWKK